MTIYNFLDAHPFIAWCALWLAWPVLHAIVVLCRLPFRILRCINVALRGWPPAHIDADGDFRPAKEEP